MSFRFVEVTEEDIFVPNQATVPLNTKEATKISLTVCLEYYYTITKSL
jgi:hypothetical protein